MLGARSATSCAFSLWPRSRVGSRSASTVYAANIRRALAADLQISEAQMAWWDGLPLLRRVPQSRPFANPFDLVQIAREPLCDGACARRRLEQAVTIWSWWVGHEDAAREM